jgi:hypothetical protein
MAPGSPTFDCDIPRHHHHAAHDGEDMAPTKRIDEVGDDGVESADPRLPTARIGSGPRMVHGTAAAHASRSRDSPAIEGTSGKAQRFQIWVMSCPSPRICGHLRSPGWQIVSSRSRKRNPRATGRVVSWPPPASDFPGRDEPCFASRRRDRNSPLVSLGTVSVGRRPRRPTPPAA